MTEKNILQNWFVTGAKPTQEQFWAWQESYWHKSESIPTEKILGLSEVLANKADVGMLQHKANLDSSNLTNEHVIAWKEKLGVGELPSNLATIDEGNKQGNTYTKEKVNELLENSGKNLANADLQIPAGTVRTLNVTGAKFGIQGLENKKTDASFNRRIKANEKGVLAYTDEPDINITFPADFKASLTVNHIYPTNIPERPAFAEDLQRVLGKIREYSWTNIDKSATTTENNSIISHDTLPSDKDFIVQLINHSDFSRNFAGIGRGGALEFGVRAGGNHIEIVPNSNMNIGIPYVPIIFIIKVNGVITIISSFNETLKVLSFNANEELGDYTFVYSKELNTTIKYHIFN